MLAQLTKEFKAPVLVPAGTVLDSTPDGNKLSFSGSIGKPLVPNSVAVVATVDAATIAIADALEALKSIGTLTANRFANSVVQDLTYSAALAGATGEQITITYVGGGTAGSESVAVSGLDITVTIENNVSTADQIKTAVDADVESKLLVTVAVSGTGSNAQRTVSATNLAGGVDDIDATGTLTLTGQPLDTETVDIGGKTYTFQDTLTDVDGNVLIGAAATDSLDNLIAAINLGAGSGTVYAASTTANFEVTALAGAGDTMDVTAIVAGVFGNAIVSTEGLTNGSWGGGTLTGGTGTGATETLTLTGLPLNTETVTIGSRTYTWQDTLTDVDGNIKIPASAALAVTNLVNAVTLRAGVPGTDYANSMTVHADVFARDGAGDTVDLTAIVPGTPGNSLVSIETLTNGSFGATTFSGGQYAVKATLIEQDITYTADLFGVSGNSVTVEYVGGATAGSERVTVSGNAIEVQVEYGVSDADDIVAAVQGDGDASALVDATVSGAGATVQVDVDTIQLAAGAEVTGTIDYLTGDWTLVFTTPPDTATNITVAYSNLLEGANDINNQLLTEDGFDEVISALVVENLSAVTVNFMFFGSNDLGVTWIPIQRSAGVVKPDARVVVPWGVDFEQIKVSADGGRLRISA